MQKVMPFTKTIALLFSGGLDRIFVSLFQGNTDSVLDEVAYEKLIEMLESPKSKYKKADIFEAILKYIEKHCDWPRNLRILMVLHKLTHFLGDDILHIVGSKRATKLTEYKATKSTTAKNGLSALIPLYFTYLQKLNYNQTDLDICFYNECEALEPLPENVMSFLHFLQKIQNIIKDLFKIFPLLEKELIEARPSNLIKEATYFFLTDSFYYYNYINHMMTQALQNVFTLPPEEALIICEIYSDHIQITKKLKNFFDLKAHLRDFFLPVPDFFNLDPEFNKKVELYGNEIRAKHPKKKENKTSICSLTIDTDHITSPRFKGSIEDKQTSLNEFSAKTPKRRSSLLGSEKSLFKPPRSFLRKKTPFAAPKIKVIKPKNRVDESRSKTLLVLGNETNQNLLRVPEDRHGEPEEDGDIPPTPAPVERSMVRHSSAITLGSCAVTENTLNVNEAKTYGLMIPNERNNASPMNCRSLEPFVSTHTLNVVVPEKISLTKLH